MDILFRAAAVCVVGSILAVTIRKFTPELSLLLSLCAGIAAAALCGGVAGELYGAFRSLAERGGVPETLLRPVVKCVAAGLVTDFTVRLCKDAGQSAAAAFMELCGTLCALYAALPLITALFASINALL